MNFEIYKYLVCIFLVFMGWGYGINFFYERRRKCFSNIGKLKNRVVIFEILVFIGIIWWDWLNIELKDKISF